MIKFFKRLFKKIKDDQIKNDLQYGKIPASKGSRNKREVVYIDNNWQLKPLIKPKFEPKGQFNKK